MDPVVQQLLTGGGTGATILVLCYLLVRALLQGFSTELQASRTDFGNALAGQRKDFTDSLAAVRQACNKMVPVLLLMCMLSLVGCSPGQGGEAGALKLSAFGGTFQFAGFTVDNATTAPTTQPVK